MLIENGVNVNCADYDQRTALHVAASRARAEVAFFLVNCPNVDVNPLDRSDFDLSAKLIIFNTDTSYQIFLAMTVGAVIWPS